MTRAVEYHLDDDTFDGLLAFDADAATPRPGILVAHAWGGRSDFENGKASRLAELGYVALAIDVYGKGRRGGSIEENAALMQPLLDNRPVLQQRVLASLDALKAQDEVDATATAAIGFCFGGLCVLDLARIGAELAGVVSFHGLLAPPGNTDGNTVKSRVLVLHGWDDPMATPEALDAVATELTGMGADWQVHAYGNTVHAFTNPAAQAPERGTVYDETADRRSWVAMQNFLAELFPG